MTSKEILFLLTTCLFLIVFIITEIQKQKVIREWQRRYCDLDTRLRNEKYEEGIQHFNVGYATAKVSERRREERRKICPPNISQKKN